MSSKVTACKYACAVLFFFKLGGPSLYYKYGNTTRLFSSFPSPDYSLSSSINVNMAQMHICFVRASVYSLGNA